MRRGNYYGCLRANRGGMGRQRASGGVEGVVVEGR